MYEALEHWKQYKQEKELQNKIAQEYQLFNENGFQYKKKAKENVSKLKVSDNSSKLLTEYDKESFDEWMSDLIKKNGTTKY